MQPTKEIRAKIFCLYYGAEYQCKEIYEGEEFIRKSIFDHRCNIGAVIDSDQCQLILTDLSEITDGDAIEVAKILYPSVKEWKVERYGKHIYYLDVKEVSGYKNMYLNVNIYWLTKIVTAGIVIDDALSIHSVNYLQAYDFLRSRGYMLPAYGIEDLFAAGIAIRKTKN